MTAERVVISKMGAAQVEIRQRMTNEQFPKAYFEIRITDPDVGITPQPFLGYCTQAGLDALKDAIYMIENRG